MRGVKEAPGHAEVDAPEEAVVEAEEEVLAAALDILDAAAGDLAAELVRRQELDQAGAFGETQASVIVRPTTMGSRSRRMVSTSGSSGTGIGLRSQELGARDGSWKLSDVSSEPR